ncbi:hypothetical protein B5X24_HaOG209644 [Helicoverpa armigera]|uniref:Uncharacterized protein n=1 Tax=Helicoverpa armigera TaxID=29058 RepID=A0A2W1BJE2_HELAM|nr:hypothetical protein B5X24_HaOG209644 [Helicoverpa armigera]
MTSFCQRFHMCPVGIPSSIRIKSDLHKLASLGRAVGNAAAAASDVLPAPPSPWLQVLTAVARSTPETKALSIVLLPTRRDIGYRGSRWQRSRSRERCPAGTTFTLAPGPDSSGTEYAGDQSSEHSTPANSPRHRIQRVVAQSTLGIRSLSIVLLPTRPGIGYRGVSLDPIVI